MVKLELSDYFSDIYDKGDVPRFRILIGNKWEKTADKLDLITPVDGAKIAEIGSVNEEEMSRVIDIADKSRAGIRDMAAIDRIELMNSIRLELQRHRDEIVRVLMSESGKSFRSATGEFNAALERMRLSMEDSRKIIGEYLPCSPRNRL